MEPQTRMLQELPDDVRQTLRAYMADVAKLFGQSMEGVLLYGSAARGEYLPGRSNLNLVLFLSAYDLAQLGEYAKIHRRWQKEGIVVPLFLTEGELQSAADAFPLECSEIKEAHLLLKGRDPFHNLHINMRNLRTQCELEIRGNLMRLRQRFVEGGGKPETAAILMPLSLTALIPAIRGIFRVTGFRVQNASDATIADLKPGLDLDPTAFQEALSLKRGIVSPGPVEMPRMFERYYRALQDLVSKLECLEASVRP
jgi:hypothetical protein